jgi:hypothetical protein
MDSDDRVEAELAELARRTDALRPRPGFQARVLNAVRAERTSSFHSGLLGSGRRVLPAAALAAVLSVIWAVASESSANAALAVVDDPVELAW